MNNEQQLEPYSVTFVFDECVMTTVALATSGESAADIAADDLAQYLGVPLSLFDSAIDIETEIAP